MFINFRSFPPQSRGFFVMARLGDSGWHFSPICDERAGRDLFAAAMSNPAVTDCSLIEREPRGEYELATFARTGIIERTGTAWRAAMATAHEAHEARRARLANPQTDAGRHEFRTAAEADGMALRRAREEFGPHVGLSDLCQICRTELADFTATGGQFCSANCETRWEEIQRGE